MLDKLRRAAAGPIAIIPIGLLVLSFAVWGIADIFSGGGNQPVATVGEIEITAAEFERAVRNDARLLGAQMNRQLTTEEIRGLGIDRAVLNRLVNGALVDNHAQALGLRVTDRLVAEQIARDPAFAGLDGRFDKARFQELLSANQLSEAGYVERQRRGLLRQQITDALLYDINPPKALLEARNQYQNAQRKLSHFSIDERAIAPIKAPDDKSLKAWFQQRKHRYMAPEYRKIGLILLTPEALAPGIAVDEADIRQAYEERKGEFEVPEKRRLEQIAFPDEKAAQAARKKIRRAKDFYAAAKAAGFTREDIKLGLVARSEMIDKAIADAAFALKKGQISQPVKGTFSTVILRVVDIVPGEKKSYQQVKAQLRADLARNKAIRQINELQDSIDEERAAGVPLRDIAQKLSLTYQEIAAADARGQDPQGKAVALLAKAPRLVAEAFKAEPGEEIEAVPVPDDGLAWLEVLDVTERKLKDFKTIRKQVLADWRAAELRQRLAKKANALVAEARKGKSFAELAKSVKRKVKTGKPFRRAAPPKDFPQAAVELAFTLAKGGVASAPVPGGRSYILYQVSEIIPAPPLDAKQEKNLKTALVQEMTDDFVAQYVRGLRGRFPVEINQKAYNQVTGR